MNSRMTTRALLLTSVAALALLAAPPAPAQPRPVVTEPAYRELRKLAQQLDDRARRAASQAGNDKSRLYRRDDTLVRLIANFTREASQFNSRMAEYRARPWPLNEDLRNLLQGAQEVQRRVRQSRYVNDKVLGDWNETVEIVNRMAQVGDGRINLGEQPPPPVYERDPRERPPDYRRDGHGPPNPSGPGGSRAEQLAGLTRELGDRAARALETAERVAASRGPYRREFMSAIRDFNTQAGAFSQGFGSGTMNPGQVRAEASRLLESARENDQRMRQAAAFREVWPDWQGAIQALQRIVEILR